MNDKQSPATQDAALDGAVHTGENAPLETAGEHRRRGAWPYSLVPALTLVALQFLQEEPSSLFDIFFVNSAGKGGHRPAPQ